MASPLTIVGPAALATLDVFELWKLDAFELLKLDAFESSRGAHGCAHVGGEAGRR